MFYENKKQETTEIDPPTLVYLVAIPTLMDTVIEVFQGHVSRKDKPSSYTLQVNIPVLYFYGGKTNLQNSYKKYLPRSSASGSEFVDPNRFVLIAILSCVLSRLWHGLSQERLYPPVSLFPTPYLGKFPFLLEEDGLGSEWLSPGYYVTQIIIGRGNFAAKLAGFGLRDEGNCACGILEIVGHVVLEWSPGVEQYPGAPPEPGDARTMEAGDESSPGQERDVQSVLLETVQLDRIDCRYWTTQPKTSENQENLFHKVSLLLRNRRLYRLEAVQDNGDKAFY
ncbi:hypothetical protein AAG570_004470 [Ranatra chinensis]|uniref:Uncharacterized protein n=1 Tax=Ranatra chinensis TaxID=642074 RepID=A0ABD0Y0Y4_9HEMI